MTTLTFFCLSLCLAPRNISIRFLDPDDQLLKDAVTRGRLWFSDRLLYSFQPQHLWLLFLFALCNLFPCHPVPFTAGFFLFYFVRQGWKWKGEETKWR